MTEELRVIGERIYLRELTEEDASEEYCNWLNDAEVNKYLETREATIDSLKEYIRERSADPNCLFFGIFLKDNDKHIGNIKLEPIDFDKKIATTGIIIGDKNYWGQGIGTETIKLLADYSFNTLKLDEVNLGVISENKAAIRVYEKVGFKIVEIKKKAMNHDGVLYDKIVMVLKK